MLAEVACLMLRDRHARWDEKTPGHSIDYSLGGCVSDCSLSSCGCVHMYRKLINKVSKHIVPKKKTNINNNGQLNRLTKGFRV